MDKSKFYILERDLRNIGDELRGAEEDLQEIENKGGSFDTNTPVLCLYYFISLSRALRHLYSLAE